MSGLFVFLFLLALILLPVSLIKPSIFSRLAKKSLSRKQLGLIFTGLTIFFFVLVGITSPQTTTPQQSQVEVAKTEQNTQNSQVNQLSPSIESPTPKPTPSPSPTPTPTPSPSPKPSPTPTKTPVSTIAPQTYTTTPTYCLNGTYINSAGNTVCRPEYAPSTPAGASAICQDGTYSFSQSRSGTCSHHGGVAQWL